MAAKIRQIVSKRIVEGFNKTGFISPASELAQDKIEWAIRYVPLYKKSKPRSNQIKVSYKHLSCSGIIPKDSVQQILKPMLNKLEAQFKRDDIISDMECISQDHSDLMVSVNTEFIIKEVLNQIVDENQEYGFNGIMHKFEIDGDVIKNLPTNQKVLVEFSSPNIAKPFHAGHLRSTIIGNFISNIYSTLGHDVVKINYLGDWGKQFGYLGVGYKRYGSSSELKKNPMEHLLNLYIQINKELHGDKKKEIEKEVAQYCKDLEEEKPEAMQFWSTCRNYTIEELQSMYKRLGIEFDCFSGESQYKSKAKELIQLLKDKKLLKRQSKSGGDIGFVDLSGGTGNVNRHVVVEKSDGSSLYITRDLVAAIDRKKEFDFDKMHYVVENGQHLHFNHLVRLLKLLEVEWWTPQLFEDMHVKFGLVQGMSTRSGQVVLLKDILDTARDKMIKQMETTDTTKVQNDSEKYSVADQLAVSAVIIQDLKEKRQQNYLFNWKRMLKFQGSTGVHLQYTHARLCSLQDISGIHLSPECDLSSLGKDDEAIKLVLHMARFDEEIHAAFTQLEPCKVTLYLFTLCHLVNNCLQRLKIKNAKHKEEAQANLLLFMCARQVLVNGMHLLCLKPVKKM